MEISRSLWNMMMVFACTLTLAGVVGVLQAQAQSGSVPGNTPPSGTVEGNACDEGMLCNPLKVNSIEELVLTIIDVILVFLLPIIILYIMYAGYLFVTAQGNPGELTRARNALLTALIGGVIVLGARAILDVVKGTIDAVTNDAAMMITEDHDYS